MFDDVKKEPEDIFAKTDEVSPKPKPPTEQPVAQQPQPTQEQVQSEVQVEQPVVHTPPKQKPENMQERVENLSATKGRFPVKAIIIVVAIILIVGVAFFISMRILKSRTPNTPEPPAVNSLMPEPAELQPTVAPTPVVVPEPVKIPEPVVEIDTDKDGLNDSTENTLGTNPNNPDTDGDGLQDREEVEVYKTNPLVADSDGDGYLDGAEVKGGYNPLGEGKLFEIPTTE